MNLAQVADRSGKCVKCQQLSRAPVSYSTIQRVWESNFHELLPYLTSSGWNYSGVVQYQMKIIALATVQSADITVGFPDLLVLMC